METQPITQTRAFRLPFEVQQTANTKKSAFRESLTSFSVSEPWHEKKPLWGFGPLFSLCKTEHQALFGNTALNNQRMSNISAQRNLNNNWSNPSNQSRMQSCDCVKVTSWSVNMCDGQRSRCGDNHTGAEAAGRNHRTHAVGSDLCMVGGGLSLLNWFKRKHEYWEQAAGGSESTSSGCTSSVQDGCCQPDSFFSPCPPPPQSWIIIHLPSYFEIPCSSHSKLGRAQHQQALLTLCFQHENLFICYKIWIKIIFYTFVHMLGSWYTQCSSIWNE